MSEWDQIVADLYAVEEDVDRAVAACEELDRCADESWLSGLHRLLSEGENFFIREAAAVPIARLEGVRALPQLLYALQLGVEEGHDNDGLNSVVAAVVEANPEEAAPSLLHLLRGPSECQRSAAAGLLGLAAKIIGPEPLLALLSDASPRVRAAAVGSLAGFKGREGVFASLMQALDDPDEGVRRSAASALGYYGDQRAVSRLRYLLAHSSSSIRRFVEFALQRLGKSP